jgi:hypothetical protein
VATPLWIPGNKRLAFASEVGTPLGLTLISSRLSQEAIRKMIAMSETFVKDLNIFITVNFKDYSRN